MKLIVEEDIHDDEMDLMPIFPIDEDTNLGKVEDLQTVLPILALKNTVLFPGIVAPITVGREKSIQAIQEAYRSDKMILVVAQRDPEEEDPHKKDLYSVGTLAKIVKLLKMPDNNTTAILQGRQRILLKKIVQERPFLKAKFDVLPEIAAKNEQVLEAMSDTIRDLAQQIIQLSPNIPSEAGVVLRNISRPTFLINFISSNLNVDVNSKQEILEINDVDQRSEKVLSHLHKELQVLEIRNEIENKVRGDLDKQQRDYYLNQQLKTIQEELGQNTPDDDLKELAVRATEKKWAKNIAEHFEKELQKLRRTNPAAAEYSITMNYLEFMLDLPWNEYTEDNFNLKNAEKVLDKDHFGLEKVKDRILEHLAVLKLKGDMKAPILCLVGPPGVGKTSLGKSIATALKRQYIRMALGGLHDESEIRGHRKTYIGAMPGRILQSLKKAKSANPVFILDEIDKVGKDFRGDPSSALLEVLDPEQNANFYDNYLELEYDLSKVLFIATANSLSTIQPALLDRMEVIEVSGYSVEEKIEIAKQHLIQQELTNHGLQAKHVKFKNEVLQKIVEDYTRESGVRELSRQIATVLRRIAKKVAMDEKYTPTLKISDLKEYLGATKYTSDIYENDLMDKPGVAVGLAWTQVGGDILFIEVSKHKGKGGLTLTGNLGDVMKESATTALSFIKAHHALLGIPIEILEENNLHLHVPAGAIPKDGPSAGITILSALASALTNRPLRKHIAMTGEITLRGKVLPVGGIKEKILAAKRAGIKEIILCKENEKDIEQIKPEYIEGMLFHYVTDMLNVLELALTPNT